jgi:hypothetical protein
MQTSWRTQVFLSVQPRRAAVNGMHYFNVPTVKWGACQEFDPKNILHSAPILYFSNRI